MNIKTVNTELELKKVFNFLAETFYDDAIENNEHYYTMSERFDEMKNQFKVDKNMIMYIEKNNKIVAAISGKNMREDKITLGIMAVSKNERKKGLAKALINEFEEKCKSKNIKTIELGARFKASPFYQKLNYNYSLMIQVFDFTTIEDVKKANIFNFKEGFSYQGETYGFIFYKVDEIKKEYIEHFEKNVKTAHVQYIFEKEL